MGAEQRERRQSLLVTDRGLPLTAPLEDSYDIYDKQVVVHIFEGRVYTSYTLGGRAIYNFNYQ